MHFYWSTKAAHTWRVKTGNICRSVSTSPPTQKRVSPEEVMEAISVSGPESKRAIGRLACQLWQKILDLSDDRARILRRLDQLEDWNGLSMEDLEQVASLDRRIDVLIGALEQIKINNPDIVFRLYTDNDVQ